MSENTSEVVAPQVPDEFSVAEITVPTTGALRRMEAEVAALDKAFRWAKAMSKTQMVPDHFRQDHIPKGANQPLGEVAAYNLAAAVMYGIEIGLSAMQSAQNVFVVHGRPAVYARTMAAQVRAAGYQIEEVEASDEKVVWKGLRDGVWAFSEWTMQRASTAGYTSNDRYQKNPTEMLRAKAIAEVCRIKYQDVLLGMSYSVEELQLEEATVQRVVRPGVRGTAKLRELAETNEAAYDEQGNQLTPAEPEEAAPEEPGKEPPNGAQLAEIRKLYKARGFTGQALLDEIAQFLQREQPLKTLQELTHDEAADVIKHVSATPQES